MKHFEDLWNAAEALITTEAMERSVASLIMELNAKFNLYSAIDVNDQVPQEECDKLKARLFGKFMLTLTQLSLKDNINVFEVMKQAYDEAQISQLEAKYRV